MQLIIQGKNIELSDWMKSYVEKKLDKLDRYLNNISETRVELSYEATKNVQDRHVVQVTVVTAGKILRAEERAADIRDAIDTVVDKMYRQIARYKGKAWFRVRPAPSMAEVSGMPRLPEGVTESPYKDELDEAEDEDEEEEEEEEEGVETGPIIRRRKRFLANPMNEQEAIEQMEMLGHDFFIFYNVQEARINVVYRLRDGTYGVLQPELA